MQEYVYPFEKILHVDSLHYEGDYKLLLKFNNGVVKLVDLKNELWGEVFVPLKNLELFKTAHVDGYTVTWDNGADFAPEYLYEIGQVVSD